MSNLMFLTFFINSIKAVYRHADLIRASIGSAGNEHRLGANEAPPAIISVFIGQQLSAVLDQLENVKGGKMTPEEKTDLKLNVVGKIPDVLLTTLIVTVLHRLPLQVTSLSCVQQVLLQTVHSQ